MGDFPGCPYESCTVMRVPVTPDSSIKRLVAIQIWPLRGDENIVTVTEAEYGELSQIVDDCGDLLTRDDLWQLIRRAILAVRP